MSEVKNKISLIDEGLFKPTITSFVEPNTGEVFSVPSTRFRTLSDLKDYNDNEKNLNESLTDETGYIPLSKDIERFFRLQDDGLPPEFVDEGSFDDVGIDVDPNFASDIIDNAEILTPEALSDTTSVQPQPEDNTTVSEVEKSTTTPETATTQQV